ncbi:hypothetical protein [Lyngbya aestuarii]|uniref:hypothetical protein n=1 Tax=Lyngbya aestuarii TaxID=118322 RepID=UPI00403DB165
MSYKIYAPNVHLFACHLRNEASDYYPFRTEYDEQLLWRKCSDIFAKFKITQELKLKTASEGYRVNLLDAANNHLLPLEGEIFYPRQAQRITGCVCPLQIDNAYILALNLRIPEFDQQGQKTEQVDTAVFQNFNPAKCFLPNKINSSLGQTLLLTAWLSQSQQQQSPAQWRAIANECLQNFLGDKLDNCPALYQEGNLFGSPIFEYGIPDHYHAFGHVFVWLFFEQEADNRANQKLVKPNDNFVYFYQTLIDLCLYRQKIIKAYQFSASISLDIYQGYQQIKQTFQEIAQQVPESDQVLVAEQGSNLSEGAMDYLKEQLRTLPKLALVYTEWLRQLENYRLTINTNTQKYAEKIKGIQQRFPQEDLSFLTLFNQQICVNWQNQIQSALDCCVQSSNLIDKGIASIRGIVEIEKARSDRALEKAVRQSEIASQAKEKKLQNLIMVVVIGLALIALLS